MDNHNKYVYRFGNKTAEGNMSMKALLGGKGANLAEMSAIGLPVPPGFTITTEACKVYHDEGGKWPSGLEEQLEEAVVYLETVMGKRFGDPKNPLLVSVRSGAAASMPGMMDTVLNLGMSDVVAAGLEKLTGNPRFAYDSYRRFIQMFGDVVMGVEHELFEEAIQAIKDERGVKLDTELSADDLKELVDRFKAIYRRHTGFMFPDKPLDQLKHSVNAVFKSWNNSRAIKYRRINRITGLIGTAVNVQVMVFGNMGDDSGTGVCFTRNPSTGEHKLYGEYLINAQGEDVVAGIRTPEPIDKLEEVMPKSYRELLEATNQIEKHYKNMQDIEFTVQDGELFILQTRNGKRTGAAAVKIAVDMVREGLVSTDVAVRDLVEPGHLDQLLHKHFEDDSSYKDDVIGIGLPASPGAAVGQVVFNADQAEEWKAAGKPVVLVRVETSPDDVGGMNAAEGILTSRGGMTSHAAVVARGWGKPCVAGCGDIVINYGTKSFTNGEVTVHEGDWISLNGSTGEVIVGKQKLVDPELSGDFADFMRWVDEYRTVKVRTNADTPKDARQAIAFGAEGIGLCRTEHMFFEGRRIDAMREMILANTEAERRAALDKLLPYQKEDFIGIFRAMAGLPVTIRLLDPPLHEFLPHTADEQQDMADHLNVSIAAIEAKVEALRETNPMLGHRGCRLGISYPEITEMQTRAIIEAAVELDAEGVAVLPEIMIPLVGAVEELHHQKDVISRTAEQVFAEKGRRIEYLVGSMIEVPRAALNAGYIAKYADFFSFGTNDLTQLVFGYSRDDIGVFLPNYVEQRILPDDPFQVLDPRGVGTLVKWAVDRARETKPGMKLGICGEHGGEASSVDFFVKAGLDYVSCSPFRVPIARLAAAQTALRMALTQPA